ncbi:MAG: hypothetical protein Q7S52_01135 [bacterium]|nr:hypothetical protein [bacterium]
MEHPDFTERDKHRLASLQKIADEMLDEAMKDSSFKRWEQLLGAVAFIAFACIFFLPHGRGETNFALYFFFLSAISALVLFFYILFWKGKIAKRVEGEFFDRHGKEYKELSACRDAAERSETGNWMK